MSDKPVLLNSKHEPVDVDDLIEICRANPDRILADDEIGLVAYIYLNFSDDLTFAMFGSRIQFGPSPASLQGEGILLKCEKNFVGESCPMEFLRTTVLGKQVTSAGDWGNRFEFGLSDDLMLAIEPDRLQIYRTRNPIDQNLL